MPVIIQEVTDQLDVFICARTLGSPCMSLVSSWCVGAACLEEFVPMPHPCFAQHSVSIHFLQVPPTLDWRFVLGNHKFDHSSLLNMTLHSAAVVNASAQLDKLSAKLDQRPSWNSHFWKLTCAHWSAYIVRNCSHFRHIVSEDKMKDRPKSFHKRCSSNLR